MKLICVKESIVGHFGGAFIKDKEYEVFQLTPHNCIEAENGVSYILNDRNQLLDIDLSFNFKPLFKES